ncbi:type IV pilin protein [Pseudomonas sp. TMP25]|uniref:type IV pilin protein n=1 Tax=Pseudomonas sp. TMP25 TaxID=3136561 RepID=UPI003100F2FB
MSTNSQGGFTLIEMMIVIGIIAILAAIALPNYQGYMNRTVCEDAKGVLAGAAGAMERFRAQNNTYIGAALAEYAQSPVDGNAQFNIVADPITATTYTLTATPVAGGRLSGRGTLTLTSTGARGVTDGATAPGFNTADIWNSSCRGL